MLSSLALLTAIGFSGLDVRVDPRIELVTIVFRLAGSGEFRMDAGESPYSKRVDEYFSKYKDHPAVRHAAEIREEYGIGFNAVPSLAVHLKDTKTFDELVPFDQSPGRWDERWKPEVARSFVKDLKSFVKDSHFDDFIQSEQSYYTRAAAGLRNLAVRFPVDRWMTEFYGVLPDRPPFAIVGLLCGGGNYGMSVEYPNHEVQISPVLGAEAFDAEGVPVFEESSVPLLIHEFSHAYVNPLVEPSVDKLKHCVEAFAPVLKDVWAAQAYSGSRTILCEGFVRSVETYLSKKYLSESVATNNLHGQRTAGFLWTSDLSEMLTSYEADRGKFKTYKEFLPKQFEKFEELAKTPQTIYDRCPVVSRFEPIFNGDKLSVHVEFDQPMMTKSRGFSMEPPGWKVESKTAFAADGRSFDIVLSVTPEVDYAVTLNRFGGGLMSEKGYPLLPRTFQIRRS